MFLGNRIALILCPTLCTTALGKGYKWAVQRIQWGVCLCQGMNLRDIFLLDWPTPFSFDRATCNWPSAWHLNQQKECCLLGMLLTLFTWQNAPSATLQHQWLAKEHYIHSSPLCSFILNQKNHFNSSVSL